MQHTTFWQIAISGTQLCVTEGCHGALQPIFTPRFSHHCFFSVATPDPHPVATSVA